MSTQVSTPTTLSARNASSAKKKPTATDKGKKTVEGGAALISTIKGRRVAGESGAALRSTIEGRSAAGESAIPSRSTDKGKKAADGSGAQEDKIKGRESILTRIHLKENQFA